MDIDVRLEGHNLAPRNCSFYPHLEVVPLELELHPQLLRHVLVALSSGDVHQEVQAKADRLSHCLVPLQDPLAPVHQRLVHWVVVDVVKHWMAVRMMRHASSLASPLEST